MQNQLHVVANAEVTAGGEALAACRYAESIALAGCGVTLLSTQFSENHTPLHLGNSPIFRQIVPISNNFLIELFDQYHFVQRLCENRKIHLIHIHGMWSPFLAVAALVARSRRIPIVISPHGCLEPWALSYKYYKKWLAMKVYQGMILRSVSLFVATANQELKSIRKLGLRQPIAVIPNGVDVGPPSHKEVHKKVKTILFLSRIHPIKGLLDLVEAWAKVRRPDWRIIIAGGDEDGYRAKVEALISSKKLDSDFIFTGFVDGARKQECFDAADIFILPTYSENFGISIAEALANELPVITTTGAPWHDLVEKGCGWWVVPGVHGVSGALSEAMECDPAELRKMGQRGRQLVLCKYSWDRIGSTALATSHWLLNHSQSKPEVVDVFRP